MGTKRVGLARIEALMENLKREIAFGAGEVANRPTSQPVSLAHLCLWASQPQNGPTTENSFRCVFDCVLECLEMLRGAFQRYW